MIYGLDYLGGARYGDLIVKEHPEGWAAGFFFETFGDATPAITKLLSTGRCPLVRIHLLWNNHLFGATEVERAKRLARKVEAIAQRFKNVKVEVSPFCEHRLQNPDSYLDQVAQQCPSCTIVNSPEYGRGRYSKKYKNDCHGSHPKPNGKYNFSFDGLNCVDTDIEMFKQRHASSDVFFFWHPRFNLKWAEKDTTPISQRRALPDSNLIDSVIYLKNDRGATKPARGMTLKSHAENHGPSNGRPDPKGDKLLIIAQQKAATLELRAANGQTVDTLVYYGSYSGTGGGYRYYSKTWGFLIAEKAQRIQGTGLVKITYNGKELGVVNPAFRDGTFRNTES